ncbi:MAG: hypothetical protein FVQ82_07060 [Planctomycetes bacterium]|nr:hypothetical protein [Planctomycetota bacterium]
MRLLLLVCRFFPVVDQYALVKWTWKVGRTTEDGFRLVMMTVEKFGLGAGRALAHEILQETRSAMIVYGIAHAERLEKNYDAAKEWIDLAEEMGCEDCYHLLSVKLGMSHKIAEYDHGEIVEEMLACNYLPMEYTHQALLNKAYLLFKERQYPKAEEIVDHILRIKKDLSAEYLKAEMCLIRNEDTLAKKLLAKSRKHLSEIDYNVNVALAYFAADRVDESMEWIYKAVRGGYKKEQGHPAIKYIIESDRFSEYCAMRN